MKENIENIKKMEDMKNIENFSREIADEAKKITAEITPNHAGKTSPISEQNPANHIGVINAYSKNKRLTLMVVGAAVGLAFCLIILTTYKGDLPGEVVGIISTVAGMFGACLKDAYSFEFGSSRGSKEKDDRIARAIMEWERSKE